MNLAGLPDLNKINPYYGAMDARLTCHPKTPCDAISSIEVALAVAADDTLSMEFKMAGHVEALLVPAPAPAARRDNLWAHTCCEMFAGPAGRTEYREYNFSPSTEWAAYAFSAYREDMTTANLATDPIISTQANSDLFELRASNVRVPFARDSLKIGVSVVIEEIGGRLSYWALTHPSEQPDFHHRDGFELDASALEVS